MSQSVIVKTRDTTAVVIEQERSVIVMRGIPGPPGTDGAGARYVHNQAVASSVWTIPHNMHTLPSVTVVDTQNQLIAADIKYVDNDIVQITHSVPVAGRAFCI